MSPTVDEILAAARARLHRLDPTDAAAAVDRGALLVDTRPEWQRRVEGEIPGALLIERNHLEWRLDPASDARIPEAVDHDVEVIVMCSEGYASSLAAASLQDLGLHRATDLVGGFHAWRAAGFPVQPAVSRKPRIGFPRPAPTGQPTARLPERGGGGGERSLPVEEMHGAGEPGSQRDHDRAEGRGLLGQRSGEERGARSGEHERQDRLALRRDHRDAGGHVRVGERLLQLRAGGGAGRCGDQREAGQRGDGHGVRGVRSRAAGPRAGPAARARGW